MCVCVKERPFLIAVGHCGPGDIKLVMCTMTQCMKIKKRPKFGESMKASQQKLLLCLIFFVQEDNPRAFF